MDLNGGPVTTFAPFDSLFRAFLFETIVPSSVQNTATISCRPKSNGAFVMAESLKNTPICLDADCTSVAATHPCPV